jgi:2-iminobutanoate/2-iminopropanoate deaminase
VLENLRFRQDVMGQHAPASTVVIAGIFDEAWLLEIDAIAVA